MQFHLNGFKLRDPKIYEPTEQYNATQLCEGAPEEAADRQV
jgi:hypothetical protein